MAIPNHVQTSHHVGSVLEDIPMGVRAEDFVHVAFMFENLYSNPIAACVREISTNAWDSHVFAGNPNPIEITLPTEADLHFTVQDYGVGMSVDTVREIFANYGASNKRDTNAVAGQLGMGSKSPLSYAVGFYVTAVRNGVKVSVLSTKDEHGLGVLKVLDTCGTDEPNGVQVKIPVDRWDVGRFRSEAESLFQFWQPGSVLIDGEAPAVPEWRANALSLDEWDHTLLIQPDSGLHSSYVVMGNVPYPVQDVDLGRVSHRFVAQLNISDVDFAPSREDLRYTQHTESTLAALRDYVRLSYKRAIDKTLAAVSTRWEEAALKVLWMDRNLRIDTTDPIWHYTPHGWGHRKAQSHFRYGLRTLAQPGLIVITGYPSKTLSTPARDRLREFVPSTERNQTFIVFPKGAPVGMLDGRPNTFTWDEVVGATTEPVVKGQKVKRAKIETRYAIRGGGDMTADELSKVKGKVLYLEPGLASHYGDLGATVVVLRSSNQIARLKRFVPKIKPYHEAVEAASKKAKAALTEQDSKIANARTLPEIFQKFKANDVDDPELAEAIRLHNTAETATMAAARAFGHTPKVTDRLADKFNKRYPLLSQVGYYSYRLHNDKAAMADALVYINTKFDMLTDPALDSKAS